MLTCVLVLLRRRALLHHVLLPALRLSPPAFQARYLGERAPDIAAILSSTPTAAPDLLWGPSPFWCQAYASAEAA